MTGGKHPARKEIPVDEIIAALAGVQISMPGHVIKQKKKFSVSVNAKYSGTSGDIVIRVVAKKGWKVPTSIITHFISIRRASTGQALKHRVHFRATGEVTLAKIGTGDYILQVF